MAMGTCRCRPEAERHSAAAATGAAAIGAVAIGAAVTNSSLPVDMVLRSSTGIPLTGTYPYGYYGNQGYGYGNGNQGYGYYGNQGYRYGNGNQGYRYGNGNQGYRYGKQRQEQKGQIRERSRRDQTGR